MFSQPLELCNHILNKTRIFTIECIDIGCEYQSFVIIKIAIQCYLGDWEHLIFLLKHCFSKLHILITVLFRHCTNGCCGRGALEALSIPFLIKDVNLFKQALCSPVLLK